MIKIKAFIKLYKQGRKSPFRSGYRPDFNFVKDNMTCGHIALIDREMLSLGEEALVEIAFLNKDLLGSSFAEGSKFVFYEGKTATGEGEVKEIIQWE